jgi:hypothetical protein
VSDVAASNGKYVTVDPALPESIGSAPADSAGWIDIPISVATNGTAYIFGRVNCPTANDDSFWIRIDGGSWTMLNGLTTSGWQWISFGNASLTTGSHTLTIGHRENGALLDKISISDSLATPTGMGVPAAFTCP